jgi:hypothetical protein
VKLCADNEENTDTAAPPHFVAAVVDGTVETEKKSGTAAADERSRTDRACEAYAVSVETE